MNPSSDDPSLRERFRELREHDIADVHGFGDILELHSARRDPGVASRVRGFALAFVGAATAIVLGVCVVMRPPRALKLDSGAMQLADWKSPTSFLLVSETSTTRTD